MVWQGLLLPAILPAATGAVLIVTERLEAGPLPAPLVPYTLTFPETAAAPNEMLTDVVPCPLMIVAPAGAVHTSPVAPAMVPTE